VGVCSPPVSLTTRFKTNSVSSPHQHRNASLSHPLCCQLGARDAPARAHVARMNAGNVGIGCSLRNSSSSPHRPTFLA
jgi:hypothetical protein